MSPVLAAFRRAREQLRADVDADPYLLPLLAFAAVLAGFWVWHGLPNVATRDERRRVIGALQPVGRFVERPSLESIHDGVTAGVTYGGTIYVYGLALLPTILFMLATDHADVLVRMSYLPVVSTWESWQAVPAWAWTATVLSARLVNVAFAVGAVYVVYRIGTTVSDRATGRLAALLMTLTWGLLVLAHEAGEDVPALFFFLLAVNLALRYVESGSRRTFYWGCLCGGIAAGFKFTAGVSALVLGVAVLQRVRLSDEPLTALVQPRLFATGVALGVVAILASYPQVLVGEAGMIAERLGRAASSKSEPHSYVLAPSWWWIARGYLNGLGLPLAVASVLGVGGGLAWLRERSAVGTYSLFALVAVGVTLAVYARWSYVRTHHLLVTFPLLAVLVAVGSRRLLAQRAQVGRVLVAALVVSTGAYAVVGDLGYASQGRDEAADWLATHAGPDDTIETYTKVPQEAGVPHDPRVVQPDVPGNLSSFPSRCPAYVVLNYHRGLLFLAPEDYMLRAKLIANETARAHVAALLDGEYPYEVVRRFGREPRFLHGEPRRPPWWGLLRVGVRPRTIEYGDPQDIGVDQYTVVLERTGPCGNLTGSGPPG